MNLDADDFTLFGLPQQFALERATLDARWKALQSEVHPDRYASEGAAAQRVAMQWAVRVNEAYQRLKDPLKRASYLCEINGAPIRAESNTAMPPAFLMQQMEWREALDEARELGQMEALHAQVVAARKQQLARLGETIDTARDFKSASEQVRALMFVEKFAEEVDRKLEALES